MHKTYNKLVRDRIPEIIHQEGRECAVQVLTEDQYRLALLTKLAEEAKELAEAPTEEILKELSDIYEVLDALLAVYGLTSEQVAAMQTHRRATRGAFTNRLNLLWTD